MGNGEAIPEISFVLTLSKYVLNSVSLRPANSSVGGVTLPLRHVTFRMTQWPIGRR